MRYLIPLLVFCVGCGSSNSIAHLSDAHLPFDRTKVETELRGKKIPMPQKEFWEIGEKDPLKVDMIRITTRRDDMHKYCYVLCNIETTSDGEHWLIGEIYEHWRNDAIKSWWLQEVATAGVQVKTKIKHDPKPVAFSTPASLFMPWLGGMSLSFQPRYRYVETVYTPVTVETDQQAGESPVSALYRPAIIDIHRHHGRTARLLRD